NRRGYSIGVRVEPDKRCHSTCPCLTDNSSRTYRCGSHSSVFLRSRSVVRDPGSDPCSSVFIRGSFVRVHPCLSVVLLSVFIRVYPWFFYPCSSVVFTRGPALQVRLFVEPE